MDYEKKYNEAFEKAKKEYNGAIGNHSDVAEAVVNILQGIFPQLRESEDERIRKWMIDEIKTIYDFESPSLNPMVEKALAYLEKQKEPENVSASTMAPSCWAEEPSLQKEQKPAEWSEEDEKRVKQLIYDTEHIRAEYEKRKKELGESFNDELIKDCDEQIAWLKSLRPDSYKNCNSRWKPSEEQMVTLLRAEGIVRVHDTKELAADLAQLYEQLKSIY